MKYTEFSEKTQKDHVTAPWEKDMADGDFVSYMPFYVGGKYRALFEKRTYRCGETGDYRARLFVILSPTEK